MTRAVVPVVAAAVAVALISSRAEAGSSLGGCEVRKVGCDILYDEECKKGADGIFRLCWTSMVDIAETLCRAGLWADGQTGSSTYAITHYQWQCHNLVAVDPTAWDTCDGWCNELYPWSWQCINRPASAETVGTEERPRLECVASWLRGVRGGALTTSQAQVLEGSLEAHLKGGVKFLTEVGASGSGKINYTTNNGGTSTWDAQAGFWTECFKMFLVQTRACVEQACGPCGGGSETTRTGGP